MNRRARESESVRLVHSARALPKARQRAESVPSERDKTTEGELYAGYHRKPCVRCGRRKREPEIYLCEPCYQDPARLVEQAEVVRLPYADQRLELVRRYHWYGEWPKAR